MLTDTYTDNGVELVIDEVNATPGFDFEFIFGEDEAVPTSAIAVQFRAYYDGNAGHTVQLQQWDYNAPGWDNVPGATFPDAVAEQSYRFLLIDDADHISAGQIEIRIVHTSPGNPLHKFHIDHMYLELAGVGEVEFRGMYRGIMRKMR